MNGTILKDFLYYIRGIVVTVHVRVKREKTVNVLWYSGNIPRVVVYELYRIIQ